MGCYTDNQYKAIGCSYTYTECKSKHMLHTLAHWGLVTITVRGEGGLQKQNSMVAASLLSSVSCAKCMHKPSEDRQQSSG